MSTVAAPALHVAAVRRQRNGASHARTLPACSRLLARSRQRAHDVARCAFFRDLFGGGGSGEGNKQAAEAEAASANGPRYSVVRATPAYELRVYDAYTAARTPYNTRPEGLQRLAEYLEGCNAAGTRLPATQPLVTRYDPTPGGGLDKCMELSVSYAAAGLASAPAPTSEGVALRAAGGEAVAARVLLGNVTPDTAAQARAQLLAALQADGLALAPEDAAGGFRLAAYGPMYSLKPRRNELLLRVRLG